MATACLRSQRTELLLRKSGTEPVIRVMVEAGTDELCKKYVDRMVDFIKEKGYAI